MFCFAVLLFFIYTAMHIIRPTYSSITILKNIIFYTRLANYICSCVLIVQTNISILASVFLNFLSPIAYRTHCFRLKK